jgi:hypothetical protein
MEKPSRELFEHPVAPVKPTPLMEEYRMLLNQEN